MERQDMYERNWDYFFDSRSFDRLLYSLQILNGFLIETAPPHFPDQNKDNDEQFRYERNNWIRKFIQFGGFEHLYNILMKIDEESIFSQEGFFIEIQHDRKTKPKTKKTQEEKMEKNNRPVNQNVLRCMAFLIYIIKIFIQGALLSIEDKGVQTLIDFKKALLPQPSPGMELKLLKI